MAPLPPVRKRTDYSDISSDDLTFALFHDRIIDSVPAIDDEPTNAIHLKAQTAEDRAMFAKMGSGGGGGGKGGGGGTLWSKGPDGKRQPTPAQRDAHELAGAKRQRITDAQKNRHVKRAGDKAEAETRKRYRIDDRSDIDGLNQWGLTDTNRATSAYRGVTIATGDRDKIDKTLNTKIRTARTRAENEARSTVDMFNSDLERGFYKTPAGAKRDRERITTSKSFLVLKDATGAYRWVSFSSNAYRDRDDEIVSTKALEADVARADADGQHGPLRWWHVGEPLGPGLDIGVCDFNAMHGRVLVESGTFSDPRIARAVAKAADQLQVSIGFVHPASDPDEGGVFHHIRRFERSLVPTGRAANPFTRLVVKEIPDMATLKERWSAFVTLMGDEAAAREVAGSAEATQKALDDAHTAFKADTTTTDPTADRLAQLEAEIASLKAAAAAPEVEDEAEYVDDGDMTDDMGGGEMSADEFLGQIGALMDQKIAPLAGLLDIEKKMAGHVQSLMGGYTAQKDAEAAERQAEIATLKARIAALEGDTPIAFRGFQASADGSTIISTEKAVQLGAPVADDQNPFADITAQLFGPQVANPNGR